MSAIDFVKIELTAALARSVRQLVLIGSQSPLSSEFSVPLASNLQVFALDEGQGSAWPATHVRTEFASEELAAALQRSKFDRLGASLFIWLGGRSYRTIDAVVASLAFIASLPKGSAVLFDYAVERTSIDSTASTALDALASCMALAEGGVKRLVQPQAVAALLRSLGFQKVVDSRILDLPFPGARLVSAVV